MAVGGLGIISLASGNPIPLLVALGGEALFVTVAPVLPAWRRFVDSREASLALDEAAGKIQSELAALPATEQQRYRRLESTAAGIRENYAQYSDASRDFLSTMTTRIDGMLERYLRMLISRDAYTKHLASNSATQLEARIAKLDVEMEGDEERVRQVKGKQRVVLVQRLEKLNKAHGDSEMLDAQLGTLEEMVLLLKEQAITMKEPEEITAQLDSLMSEIENTESTVTAIETSFDLAFDRELEKSSKALNSHT